MVSLLWGPVKQERQLRQGILRHGILRQGILLFPDPCVHCELDSWTARVYREVVIASWTAIVYGEGTPSVICPMAGGPPGRGDSRLYKLRPVRSNAKDRSLLAPWYIPRTEPAAAVGRSRFPCAAIPYLLTTGSGL